MTNLNHMMRRLVALLLCICMLMGNIAGAVAEMDLDVMSPPYPLKKSVGSMATPATEVELEDYVTLTFGLYADREAYDERDELDEDEDILEDGQSLYAVLECAFLRDDSNQNTTVLQQAYKNQDINESTVFTCDINFLNLMETPSYPTSYGDRKLSLTDNGMPVFYWWVDTARNLVCLTFHEDALKLDGTVDRGKLSFDGKLDLSNAGDDGELKFSVNDQHKTYLAKQGYTLEKAASKPRLDLDAKAYLVDYTVTLKLDRNMQLDASAGKELYTAALTLVDTLSADSALSGEIYGTPVITGPARPNDEKVIVTVAEDSDPTVNTFVIESRDKLLSSGTYTLTYQMKLDKLASAAKLKDYSEERRTNTVEVMENGESLSKPVTATATIAWDDTIQKRFKIDKDIFTDRDPLSKYYSGAYYDETDNQYYVDYRIVVYVQEEVSTFTVIDGITGYMAFPDDKPIVLEGWDGSETFWTNNIHTADLDQLPDVEVTTEPGANAHQKLITVKAAGGTMLQPGAYHLRVPICITNAVNNALDHNQAHGYNNTATLTEVDGIPTTETDTCYGQVQKYTPPEKSGSFEVNTDGSYATVEVDGKKHYLLRWELWIGWYFYNETVLQDVMEGTTLYVNSSYPFDIHSYDGRNGRLHQEKLATFNTLSNDTDFITFNVDGKGFTFNAHKLNLNTGDAGDDKSPVGAYKIVYYTVSDEVADGINLPTGIKNTYKVDYKAPHGKEFNNGPIPGEAEPQISNAAKLSVDKKFKRMLNDIYTEWQIVVHNPNAIPFIRLDSLNILDVVSDKTVTPKLNNTNQSSVNNRDNVQVLYSETWPIQVKMKLNDSTTVPLENGTHYTIAKNYTDTAFPNDYGQSEFGSNGEYGYVIMLDIEAVEALAAQYNTNTFEEITVSTYLKNSDKESGYLYYMYNQGQIIYETIGQKFRDITEAESTDQRSFSVKTKDAPLYGDYYDPTQSASYTVHSNGSTSGTTTTIRGTYDNDANTGDGQQEILWSILAGSYEFEKDSNPIRVTITDTLSSNQMFPVYDGMNPIDLFHIYSNKKPEHVIEPDSLTVDGNTFTLTFTVPGGQWCGGGNNYLGADVRVTYHTVIKPEAMQDALDNAVNAKETFTVAYNNNASVEWNGYAEQVTNSGSHTFTTDMLSKKSVVDPAESEIVYTIVINDRGMKLNGGNPLVLTDALENTEDFRYMADSFVLKNLDTKEILTKDISVSDNTYTLSWDTGFTISVPDGKRLELTYRVEPRAAVGEYTPELDNTATLNGKIVDCTQGSFKVLESDQSASVTFDDGKAGVTIRKVDATESTDHFLPKAEFTIYKVKDVDTLGNVVLGDVVETISTGDEGHVLLTLEHTSGQGFDTVFCMKETKAPEGYQANTEAAWYFYVTTKTDTDDNYIPDNVQKLVGLLNGKTVIQLKNGKSAVVDVPNNPYTCDLLIKKQSFGGAALTGAEFTLTDGNGNLVSKFTVNSEEGFKIADLKSGQYTLFENKAPDGYTLGTVSQWSFTLDAKEKSVTLADSTTQEASQYVTITSVVDRIQETGEDTTENKEPVLIVKNEEAITTLSISGTKTWVDHDDYDNIRPDTLTITLLANGQTATDANGNEISTTIEGTGNVWRYSFDDLPKYADGEEIVYTVSEETVTGYELTYGETEYDLINTHTPVTSVTVNKIWDDEEDQDGKRPDTLTINLLKKLDGETAEPAVIKTVVLPEENRWSKTWENLPKYENGKLIIYTVEEVTTEGETPLPWVADYDCGAATTNSVNNYKITNTHAPEKTFATVTKVWDDKNDQDGKRPTELTVTLSNGTETVKTVTLKKDNSWTATVNDLPMYADGKLITYTWTEGAMPEGYSFKGSTIENGTDENGISGTITTITNSYSTKETSATIRKVWDDSNDQDGLRPKALVVTLSNGTEVTLDEENDWTATINGLPKFANGTEIQYSWTEGTLPEGYELTGTSVNGTVTTLTNTHTPEKTEATVVKVWDDKNDQDGRRPKSLEVTLSNGTKVTLNEGNSWTATVGNLPKYAGGEEIEYTWTEDEDGLPEGYELTSTGKEGTVTTLTNSYVPEQINIDVVKVWDDAENQDGKRPESIYVQLYANGEAYGEPVELTDDNLTASWPGLDKCKAGTKITYTVKEGKLNEAGEFEPVGKFEDYTATIGTLTETNVDKTYQITITNKHDVEMIQLTVKKVWDDAKNQDGKRPNELKVNLSNGTKTVDTVTLNQGNEWTATSIELPKYANGTAITYTWTEEALPEGYTLTDTAKEGNITTLTNTYTPETIDITGTKTWDDDDNQDGFRPDSIIINLLADGTIVATAEVKADENSEWKWEFKDLPKYRDHGTAIVYTITEVLDEDAAAAYTATVDGYNVTNTHIPETVDVSGSKVWIDLNNAHHTRPESITSGCTRMVQRSPARKPTRITTGVGISKICPSTKWAMKWFTPSARMRFPAM